MCLATCVPVGASKAPMATEIESRSIGYEPGSQTLEVEHTDGSVWQYSRVPSEVHRRLMAAPSIVSYYRDNIEEEYSRLRLK